MNKYRATYEKKEYVFEAKSDRSAKIKASKQFGAYGSSFLRLYNEAGEKVGAKCFDEWM